MTRDEIEATDWAKQLYKQERKNNAAPGTHAEAINIVANRTPVRVIFLGDSAEVYVDTFVLEVTETVDEAIEWCKRFDLPIEAVNGETYKEKPDIVPKLLAWLDSECNDPAASWSVKNIMSAVREKVHELMREAK